MVKGSIQTLEAAIAISIILASVIYANTSYSIENDYSDQAQSCLNYLYEGGILNQDESTISSEVSECLSPALDFVIRKCSTVECSASLPDKTVSSASMISGTNVINLWVWEK